MSLYEASVAQRRGAENVTFIERLPVDGTTGKVQKNTRRELLYGYRETSTT